VGAAITRMQVFGERCSGTNFLQHLLDENVQSASRCRDFGWKHGFHQDGVEAADDCLFVVIYRNPFDWLRSLHRSPYHAASELRGISFSDFIRTEWWCIWDEHAHKTREHEMYGQEMMSERDPDTGERFADVIRLRPAKIRNWESLGEKTAHNIYVKYEDVEARPSEFISALTEQFELIRSPVFRPVEGARGGDTKYRRRKYRSIRSDDLHYILKTLDVGLEKSIGYDVDALAADPAVRSSGILGTLRNLSK